MKSLTIIIILLCSSNLYSIGNSELDSILLTLEQDAYYAVIDTSKNEFYFKKSQAYISRGIIDESSIREIKRVRYSLLKDSCDQEEFLWNAAVILQIHDDLNYAMFYLNEYQRVTSDTSPNTLLLGLLIDKSSDTAYFNNNVKQLMRIDTAFQCLSCIKEVFNYELRNKKKYVLASRIIPGLGTTLAGKELLGIGSTLTHAALVYSVFELAKLNMYVNVAAIGLSLLPRFYAGNITLTKKTITDLGAKKRSEISFDCQTKISLLLKSYPILLK